MLQMIRPAALCIILGATALPAFAQSEPEGRSLMQRGAELFLKGLRQEISPKVEDLRGLADEFGPSMRSFLSEMGPALASIMDEVQDWSRYYPPEMLPNGDIILRRKPDPVPDPPPNPGQPAAPTDI
jgi:hypothetical protein